MLGLPRKPQSNTRVEIVDEFALLVAVKLHVGGEKKVKLGATVQPFAIGVHRELQLEVMVIVTGYLKLNAFGSVVHVVIEWAKN